VTLEPKPDPVSPELAKFRGGYSATLNLIEEKRFKESQGNLNAHHEFLCVRGESGYFLQQQHL
jgi:hypothetical protein